MSKSPIVAWREEATKLTGELAASRVVELEREKEGLHLIIRENNVNIEKATDIANRLYREKQHAESESLEVRKAVCGVIKLSEDISDDLKEELLDAISGHTLINTLNLYS